MKRTISVICVVAVLTAGLYYCNRLLMKKDSYEECVPFFNNEQTFDVLFFGSSHVKFGGGLFQCELERKNFYLLLLSIGVLMAADFYKYQGIIIHKKILQQDFWFRWLAFAGGTLFILIFGIWGGNYDAKNFIYFQF